MLICPQPSRFRNLRGVVCARHYRRFFMAITLTGTGGLFTRTGVWGRLIRTLNGARGSTAPNPGSSWGGTTKTIFDLQTAVGNINAQYASTLQGIVSGLYGVGA